MSYSATVEICLLVNGNSYSVGAIGPDSLRLREPLEALAGTLATTILTVDGHEHRRQVVIEHDVLSGDTSVAFTLHEEKHG